MTAEIGSAVDRAIARLEAKADWSLECWSCGHAHKTPGDPLKNEYRCDQCGATTAFGTPMPKITITPHVDRRFLVSKFESGKGDGAVGVDIVMARGFAAEYALEILSVTEPSAYRAFVGVIKRMRLSASGPSSAVSEDIATTLDAVPKTVLEPCPTP